MPRFIETSLSFDIVYLMLTTHLTIICVTLYLHRYQSHRSYDLNSRGLEHCFRFWLWLTTGIQTQEWTAIHRKHHARSETKDDPHSPVQYGLWTVLFRGYELYKTETQNRDTIERFGKGTPNDWIEKNLYQAYPSLGITIFLIIETILFGGIGILFWSIQMAWIPFFAAGVINGMGHAVGYRNFDCPDAATNIIPWGLLIGGEELHNNHHAHPKSPKFSYYFFEFDLGWFYLKIFEALGWVVLPTSKIAKCTDILHVDLEPSYLQEVMGRKIELVTQFSHEVLRPLLQEKKDIVSQKLMKELQSTLDSWSYWRHHQSDRLRSLLAIPCECPDFARAFEMWNSFHELWEEHRLASNQELLDAFDHWRKEALALKIPKLSAFVHSAFR